MWTLNSDSRFIVLTAGIVVFFEYVISTQCYLRLGTNDDSNARLLVRIFTFAAASREAVGPLGFSRRRVGLSMLSRYKLTNSRFRECPPIQAFLIRIGNPLWNLNAGNPVWIVS